MKHLLHPLAIACVLGLLLGFSLPVLAHVIPGVTCEGCTPNQGGLTATCNQCGSALIAVGTNCDVCCASSTDCQRKAAAGSIAR